MSVCTSVVKLENISEDIDMMLVTIDSDTKAYMIGNYADTLQFIRRRGYCLVTVKIFIRVK